MTSQAALRPALDENTLWTMLRELVRWAKSGREIVERVGLRLDARGALEETAPELGLLWVDPAVEPCFGSSEHMSAAAHALLDLFLPLCIGQGARWLVVGHLGQSLDGQIATASGASRYVTGRENLAHLHRLRALSDAVVVGASTVERDDPQLTTRLVSGDSPVRVVIDPSLRVPAERRIYTDAQCPTLIVCADGQPAGTRLPAAVELVRVAAVNGRIDPAQIASSLRARGLGRLLVEGGGVTVSRFVEARVLNRLHVAVSPVLLGAGRPGLALPSIDRMEHAMRPKTRRFDLGDDVLFDCCLDAEPASVAARARSRR